MHLLNPYLITKTSTLPDSGMGLFTSILIAKNALITEHTGKISSFKNADGKDNNPYLFYITRDYVIDARHELSCLARYANDANGYTKIAGIRNNAKYVVFDKRVFITATRAIQPGEEIFVGYGKEYWAVMRYYIESAELKSA